MCCCAGVETSKASPQAAALCTSPKRTHLTSYMMCRSPQDVHVRLSQFGRSRHTFHVHKLCCLQGYSFAASGSPSPLWYPTCSVYFTQCDVHEKMEFVQARGVACKWTLSIRDDIYISRIIYVHSTHMLMTPFTQTCACLACQKRAG